MGGRFGYTDDGETANTQVTWFDYGDNRLIFEVRGLPTQRLRNVSVGNIYYCANGYMTVPNYTSATAFDLDGNVIQRFSGADNHYENWINAVRSRRAGSQRSHPQGPPLQRAVPSGQHQLSPGPAAAFRAAARHLRQQANAQNTMVMMEEHLAGNHVPLNSTSLMVGRRLTVHPTNENFPNDQEASAMLREQNRKGFEVPARS